MTTVAAVLLLLSLTSACSTLSTGFDYDTSVDFSKYHTWSWVEPDLVAQDAAADPRISPLVRQRIREVVEQELRAKGLRREDDGDLLVSTNLGLQDRQVVQDWGPVFPGSWRYGWRYGGGYGPPWYDPFLFPRTTVSTYTMETVAIDMFDARTRRPIWHGQAAKVARDNPDDAEIRKVVTAILARFPPLTAPVPAPAAVSQPTY